MPKRFRQATIAPPPAPRKRANRIVQQSMALAAAESTIPFVLDTDAVDFLNELTETMLRKVEPLEQAERLLLIYMDLNPNKTQPPSFTEIKPKETQLPRRIREDSENQN